MPPAHNISPRRTMCCPEAANPLAHYSETATYGILTTLALLQSEQQQCWAATVAMASAVVCVMQVALCVDRHKHVPRLAAL